MSIRMDGNMNMNGQNHGLPLLHPVIGGVQNLRQPQQSNVFRPQVRPPPYEQAV